MVRYPSHFVHTPSGEFCCSRTCLARKYQERHERVTQKDTPTRRVEGSTSYKGNLGLAYAIAYFAQAGYFIFIPIGDNSGAIDLVVSQDGVTVKRVQCKFTSAVYRNTYRVSSLTQRTHYHKESFDLLYVATPHSTYLIDWYEYCRTRTTLPRSLKLNGKVEQYRLP